MGFTSITTQGSGWSFSYIQYGAGTKTRDALSYYNDTGKPVSLDSVYLYFGVGASGSFGGLSSVQGAYTVTVSFTDSKGVTHTSNAQTVSNVIYAYGNVAKKTFTFSSKSYIAAGATVTIKVTFNIAKSYNVVVWYNRNSSSYYGGSVSSAGVVKVRVGNEWKDAIPYVWANGKWNPAVAYVYNGGWQPCK